MAAGRHRLIIGEITQGKLRGDALKNALGEMNKTAATPYAELAKGVANKQPKKKQA